MIQRLFTLACCINQDRQIVLHFILTDQVNEFLRAQCIIYTVVRFGFGI
jgi:hypothetical protein